MEPARHSRHDVRQPPAFPRAATKSEEGIASNILADRLKRLIEQGIVSKADDPTHKQKAVYSLTEKGIELLPVLAQMSGWGLSHLPVTEELGIRAHLLEDGGPKLWAEFMDELRETHLGVPARRKRKRRASVSARGCRRPTRRLSPSARSDSAAACHGVGRTVVMGTASGSEQDP